MDVEKAREQLQDAKAVLRANTPYLTMCAADDIQNRIDSALLALDDAMVDEWAAERMVSTRDRWNVVAGTSPNLRLILHAIDERTACRVADDHNRLGRLEKAARAILDFNPETLPTGEWICLSGGKPLALFNNLRAALTQEGQ